MKTLTTLIVVATILLQTARSQNLSEIGVNIATLCDDAKDEDGKITVFGAFDTIQSDKTPASLNKGKLALRVYFSSTQFKKHTAKIQFYDPSHSLLVEGQPFVIDVSAYDKKKKFVTKNVIVNLQGFQFPAYGNYSIKLVIGKQTVFETPVAVVK